MYMTPQSSGMNHSATMFSNSFTLNSINAHFFEMWLFWWPGNLNLTLQRDSITCSLFCSLVQMDITNQPLWALGLSKGTAQTRLQARMETARQSQASHECPLERTVSKVPQGSLHRQQTTYTTEEAAVCSHCTQGPHSPGLIYERWPP